MMTDNIHYHSPLLLIFKLLWLQWLKILASGTSTHTEHVNTTPGERAPCRRGWEGLRPDPNVTSAPSLVRTTLGGLATPLTSSTTQDTELAESENTSLRQLSCPEPAEEVT